MPTTPLLGITQVSATQNQKEITINDAILALEAATNAVLSVSYASVSTYTLNDTQATRNMVFKAVGATADCILEFPNTVNGNPFNRTVVVRNESGYGLTVKFDTGAGSTVIVPNGHSRLITGMNGTDFIVAAEPQTVVTFLDLSDAPASFAGQAGKVLAANLAENALEFIDIVAFPDYTDNEGKVLVVNATEDGVEWVAAIATFLALTDTPVSYTGHGGKLVAVKSDASGVEFIDPPPAEVIAYTSAQRWRLRTVVGGEDTTNAGWGEIDFLDLDGVSLVGSGTATASSTDTGRFPADAFDDDTTTAANGWLCGDSLIVGSWIEYDFGSPVEPRTVKCWPVPALEPTLTVQRFVIEYYDGAEWVAAGDRTAATWAVATAQSFAINGTTVPLVYTLAELLDVDVVTAPPTDGQSLVWDEGDSEWVPGPVPTSTHTIGGGFGPSPTSSEVLFIYKFIEQVTYADDFAGSVGTCLVNPTATYVMTVKKNGTSIGTISISTSGVFTFATTGTTAVFAAGDVLSVHGHATTDATLANAAFTFLGTK